MEYEINKLKKKETRFLLINFMEKTFALEEYEDTNRIIPFRKGRLIKKKRLSRLSRKLFLRSYRSENSGRHRKLSRRSY